MRRAGRCVASSSLPPFHPADIFGDDSRGVLVCPPEALSNSKEPSVTRLACLAALALALGCATTAPTQQPPPALATTEVELTVKDIDADELQDLQAELVKVSELRGAQLKSHANKVA